MKHLLSTLVLALAACGGGGGDDLTGGPSWPSLNLTQPNLVIDLPDASGSLNYVTMPSGPLTGKTLIRMRYRLDMAPGVQLVPTKFPGYPSIITLYFQRSGDDWTARGAMEAYRWYAAFANRSPVVAGEYVLEAPLDGAWSAILSSTHASNPSGFKAALDDTARVGFVLGGGDGLGHGVYATGPAKLIILSFEVL